MLLSVRDLRVGFPFEQGEAWAVDGVSFDIAEGETVGLWPAPSSIWFRNPAGSRAVESCSKGGMS
jgi:hypothetical protein